MSLTVCLLTLASASGASSAPDAFPHGIGIQLPRATASDSDEVKRAAEAGFRFARNGMDWEWVDKGNGKYDFSIYDKEVELNAKHGIRMMYVLISHAFIANPDNPKWDVRTDDGRRRFAAFAHAVTEHFSGKGVVWEIWNEPGGNFWKPKPNVDEFFPLLVETAQAVRRADPAAVIIAPGAAHAIHPLNKKEDEYLRTLIERGMLRHVDGVSVHPYQAGGKPENAVAGYEKLRQWIAKHGPPGKDIALVSSEWGYEDYIKWKDIGYVRKRQARYVVREFLVNLWQGVPLQIYFTWRASKNYGILEDDGAPKLAFEAAKQMLQTLDGFRLVERIPTGSDDQYVLRFSDGSRDAFAAWLGVEARAEGEPLRTQECTLRLPPGGGTLVNMLGEEESVRWGEEGLSLSLLEEPKYLIRTAAPTR